MYKKEDMYLVVKKGDKEIVITGKHDFARYDKDGRFSFWFQDEHGEGRSIDEELLFDLLQDLFNKVF